MPTLSHPLVPKIPFHSLHSADIHRLPLLSRPRVDERKVGRTVLMDYVTLTA